jgi:hypothetical protein
MGNGFVHYAPAFDPAFESLSLGHVHLMYTMKYLIERGYEVFDFSKGEDAYKSRWETDRSWNYSYLICLRPGLRLSLEFAVRKKLLEFFLWARRVGINRAAKQVLGRIEWWVKGKRHRSPEELSRHPMDRPELNERVLPFSFGALRHLKTPARRQAIDYRCAHSQDSLAVSHDGSAGAWLYNETKHEWVHVR